MPIPTAIFRFSSNAKLCGNIAGFLYTRHAVVDGADVISRSNLGLALAAHAAQDCNRDGGRGHGTGLGVEQVDEVITAAAMRLSF